MIKPTLVVMAAGIGSRYGGLKQIDPVGPSGEIIIDYSIYDALKTGFGKVVFIIKEEMLEDFKDIIGRRVESLVETAYVFQKVDTVPARYTKSAERTKPWGTAHAVMCCKNDVNTPFLVINADDFYGESTFKLIHDYLVDLEDIKDCYEYSMVGFKLENTLTNHGHVARGVCEVDSLGYLKGIKERTKIEKFGDVTKYTENGKNWVDISKGSTVSMNTWGFTPSIFEELENKFPIFLEENKNNILKAEYFLPTVVDSLIAEGKAKVKVITSEEQWYGVTYKEDKPTVKAAIMNLVDKGIYPVKLWGNKMENNFNFDEIVAQFNYEGRFVESKPYGLGHINDTFAVTCIKANGNPIRYILQRINTNIFKTPENLMENIKNVTTWLNDKIKATGGNPERETLNLIDTISGKSFYVSSLGDFWRSYKFIEGAQTYQVVENLRHFYNAGKALGNFEQLLADFPAEKLHETIPDFHNTRKRYETFLEALSKDVMNRAKDVQKEIDFVLSRGAETSLLVNLLNEGMLPLRVTHNDTKFNNVMIDNETGEGICVIDLDTIMPGLSLYDFGDSIRSGANPAEEDEKDLSKVCMDLELYEHFTMGFLEGTNHSLTTAELEYLPLGAKMMTFECGIRFLTDHLNGDTYFKVHRENHNLDRARTQFKMVADMEGKIDQMKAIVQKYS